MAISPPARHDAVFINANGGKVLLFGGKSGSTYLSDTWTFDGNTGVWTQLTPTTSPPARASAFAGLDKARQVAVVNGGQGASGLLGDTWEFDFAAGTWTQRTFATNPPASANVGVGGSGGLEPTTGLASGTLNGVVLIRYGGWDGTTALTDLWTYDGGATSTGWANQGPLRTPFPVAEVGGAFKYGDYQTDSGFIPGIGPARWGGGSAPGSLLAPPTAVVSPDTRAGNVAWALLTPSDNIIPDAGVMYGAAFAITRYDGFAYRDALVIFGGRWGAAGTAGAVQATQWEFGQKSIVGNYLNRWTHDTTGAFPSAREQAMVFAYRNSQSDALLFGGLDAAGVELNDMWYYTGTTWEQVGPMPRKPFIAAGGAGNGSIQVTVMRTLPTYPATSYTITASNGFTTTVVPDASGTATVIVTGLTNEVAYTFTAVATNADGSSVAASIIATPHATVPDAPASVTAVSGNASAVVSWTPPTNDGGSPITSYQVNAAYFDYNLFSDVVDASVIVPATQLSVTLTGLQNDRFDPNGNTSPAAGYFIEVWPINAIGRGAIGTTTAFPTAAPATPPPSALPVANAPSLAVLAGELAALDGSGSTGSGLTFQWSQVGGPSVTLSNSTAPVPSFTAPLIEGHRFVILAFSLVVQDSTTQASAPATANVLVTKDPLPTTLKPWPHLLADAQGRWAAFDWNFGDKE